MADSYRSGSMSAFEKRVLLWIGTLPGTDAVDPA